MSIPDVGTTLDRRYELRRLIARSDTGAVFDASHVHLGRAISVRVLDAPSEAELGRLFDEACRLDELDHPAVIGVHDVVETDGGAYLVTEPLAGRTLDGVLAVRGMLEVDDSVRLACAVGEGLEAVHQAGFTHGGLCPSSVLLMESSTARAAAMLLDVGISPNPTGLLSGPLAAMAYAAPEVLAGADASPASDVYSLGAVLCECLTGALPAEERETGGLASRLDVPVALAETVRRAIASEEVRHTTMAELLADLRDAATTDPPMASLPPPARREHARAGYVSPVRLLLPNGESLDGRSEDISEGGLLVLVAAPARVQAETEVLVRFPLPGDGRIVSVPAQIRWERAAGGRHALGLRFREPGEKATQDIRAYVELLGTPVG